MSRLQADELDAVNQALKAGTWLHRDGSRAAPLETALGTADRQLIYRVDGGIVCLLGDLAILPSNLVVGSELQAEKQIVRSFYDDFG